MSRNTQPARTPDRPGTTVQLMDERECARRLAVSLSYLRNGRCKLKGPPYVKLGGRAVRYRECDVEAWIAEHIVAPVA